MSEDLDVDEHLRLALEKCESRAVRYHIRHALQYLGFEESPEFGSEKE